MQNEWIGLSAEISHDEPNPLSHQTADEVKVAAQEVQLATMTRQRLFLGRPPTSEHLPLLSSMDASDVNSERNVAKEVIFPSAKICL